MSNSMETSFSSERLTQMIKGKGAVENRGPDGYDRGGLWEKPIYSILDTTTSMTNLTGRGEATRVVFMPLSALRSKDTGIPEAGKGLGKLLGGGAQTSSPEGWTANDVAICFAFYGKKFDASGRDGYLRGVAVMSKEDAQRFATELQKDPRLLFTLARTINGGPIRAHKKDGYNNVFYPATIQAGSEITILPNAQFGGEFSTVIKTAPFPPNYNPNPLL